MNQIQNLEKTVSCRQLFSWQVLRFKILATQDFRAPDYRCGHLV